MTASELSATSRRNPAKVTGDIALAEGKNKSFPISARLKQSVMSSTLSPTPSDGLGQSAGRSVVDLARHLVSVHGIEVARRLCRENCWDGVAMAIERLTRGELRSQAA